MTSPATPHELHAAFTDRVDFAVRATGLTPAQLGLARMYPAPITNPLRPDTKPSHARPDFHVGDLHGTAILIKDLQQIADHTAGMGSARQAFIAPHTDTVATKLLEAGATILGATHSAEFGTTAYTEPEGLEHPVNPINPAFMTGGSSGGAATAIARGLVDIAHATDGGGSIRIPAACCGLTGFKATHHASRGGFTPTSHGFITRDDATLARAHGIDIEPPSRSPLRIGYTNTPFHSASTVDSAIAAATAAVTALLTTAHASGRFVESVTPAPSPYPRSTFTHFSEVFASRCRDLPGELTPLTDWLRARGRAIPQWRTEAMETSLRALPDAILETWSDLDIVATPMLACAPPPPGTFSALPPRLNFLAQTAWTPWGTLWNMTGWASVAVPLVDPARVPGRWPIALQLGAVGDRVSEGELLWLAGAVREAARALPPEQLSLDSPGDVEALEYRPTPDASHGGEDA